jgi:hypothetical protein
MANTITYLTDFERVLQDRLDQPQTWKEMCDVVYPEGQVYRTSYISTEMTSAAVTRGTATDATDFVETSNTLTVSTDREVKVFVDYADEAQSPWTQRAEIFDRIGAILNEYIESQVLAQHATWTNLGDTGGGAVGLADVTLTVSASNIDDIIRGVKREIRVANGSFLADQYGIGFIWRAADFEFLEAWMGEGLVKLSLIKANIQQWTTHTKQAIAVQVKRLSEREPILFGYATV